MVHVAEGFDQQEVRRLTLPNNTYLRSRASGSFGRPQHVAVLAV
jgi:hypothetical protein